MGERKLRKVEKRLSFFSFIYGGMGGRERGRARIPGRLHSATVEANMELELMNHEIMN